MFLRLNLAVADYPDFAHAFAGENVDAVAGKTLLGVGELTASRGKAIVRVLRFRGEE